MHPAQAIVVAIAISLPAGQRAWGTGENWVPGYSPYVAWEDWARVRPGDQAGLASSYDRSGGNIDYNYYESPPGYIQTETLATVATISGPGVIHRFWMPHLTSNQSFVVRMYFDGEDTPRVDTTSQQVHTGAFSYFTAPLVDTFAGGRVCYEPIPFAQSLRIETVNRPLLGHYYQYTFTTFSPGTPVISYTGSLSPEQQAARDAAVSLLNHPGDHPAPAGPDAREAITGPESIAPGDSLPLLEIEGPGLVRQINLRLADLTDGRLDTLMLRVTYDESTTAAIDASLADLFGAGHQRAAYRSLPLGTDSSEGLYCYWPMPFHHAIRIELRNPGVEPIEVSSTRIVYERRPLGWDMACLHAQVSRSVHQAGGIYHPMLTATGCGHYVGNLLYVQQANYSFGLLEGDEVLTIDGTRVLNGTGLEDAYNGGYYFNWVACQSDEPEGAYPQAAIRPLNGILYVHRDTQTPIARADQYRWQIADRVPFARSLEVKIEDRYALVGAAFTSVAFWYQLPHMPGDFDADGDVDQNDLNPFDACFSGPAVPHGPGCGDTDLDGDGDVDQDDFGVFQRCYSGDTNPADPNCAN